MAKHKQLTIDGTSVLFDEEGDDDGPSLRMTSVLDGVQFDAVCEPTISKPKQLRRIAKWILKMADAIEAYREGER